MSNIDNERDMWDAINTQAQATSTDAVPTVETAITRKGARVVILTDADVAATRTTGYVRADGEGLVWYSLGKPFTRNGVQVRYGYLRYNREVAQQRDMWRDSEDYLRGRLIP